MKNFILLSLLGLVLLSQITQGTENTEEKPMEEPQVTEKSEGASTNDASQSGGENETPTNAASESEKDADQKYALGSLCNYCSYCKVGIY